VVGKEGLAVAWAMREMGRGGQEGPGLVEVEAVAVVWQWEEVETEGSEKVKELEGMAGCLAGAEAQ